MAFSVKKIPLKAAVDQKNVFNMLFTSSQPPTPAALPYLSFPIISWSVNFLGFFLATCRKVFRKASLSLMKEQVSRLAKPTVVQYVTVFRLILAKPVKDWSRALEGSTFWLSKCDLSRMFYTERSWHTYRFTVVIVSGRQDLPSGCKRIFFDLFWSVKLLIKAKWGFQFSPKCLMDLHN